MIPTFRAVSYQWHDDHLDVSLVTEAGAVVIGKQRDIDGPFEVDIEATLAFGLRLGAMLAGAGGQGTMPRDDADPERWLGGGMYL